MRKLKPLPHPSELPRLKTILRNAGTCGLQDVIADRLTPPKDPELDEEGRPAAHVIPLIEFLTVRAKMAGKDGDRLTQRLDVIAEGKSAPNSAAWRRKFKNR